MLISISRPLTIVTPGKQYISPKEELVKVIDVTPIDNTKCKVLYEIAGSKMFITVRLAELKKWKEL